MPVWDERHYPNRLLGTHDVTFIFGEDVTLPDRVAKLPPQPDQGPAFALHVEAEELCQRAREIACQMQNRDDIADGEEL